MKIRVKEDDNDEGIEADLGRVNSSREWDSMAILVLNFVNDTERNDFVQKMRSRGLILGKEK